MSSPAPTQQKKILVIADLLADHLDSDFYAFRDLQAAWKLHSGQYIRGKSELLDAIRKELASPSKEQVQQPQALLSLLRRFSTAGELKKAQDVQVGKYNEAFTALYERINLYGVDEEVAPKLILDATVSDWILTRALVGRGRDREVFEAQVHFTDGSKRKAVYFEAGSSTTAYYVLVGQACPNLVHCYGIEGDALVMEYLDDFHSLHGKLTADQLPIFFLQHWLLMMTSFHVLGMHSSEWSPLKNGGIRFARRDVELNYDSLGKMVGLQTLRIKVPAGDPMPVLYDYWIYPNGSFFQSQMQIDPTRNDPLDPNTLESTFLNMSFITQSHASAMMSLGFAKAFALPTVNLTLPGTVYQYARKSIGPYYPNELNLFYSTLMDAHIALPPSLMFTPQLTRQLDLPDTLQGRDVAKETNLRVSQRILDRRAERS